MLVFYDSKCIIVVDIEKAGGICWLTFVVDEFPGLFLGPWIVSIIHSRSVKIINAASLDFCYWLNSNISVSSGGIITVQKSLF